MATLVIQHPISGKDITIENPLMAEHVEVGRLLWYWGFTSVSGWNCPAIITQVDEKKRRFRVRSLDDMKEQDQWYDFATGKGAPTSRMTMRLATTEEVRTYLEAQLAHLREEETSAQRAHERAQKAVMDFERERSLLSV